MSFEDVMGSVMRWITATEALAALGAELSLAQAGETAPPEIATALQGVLTAAGLDDLTDLAPPQRAMVLGVIKTYLRQSLDVVDAPGRAPGWTYTDPDILDGWGRGSSMVPMLIAASHPDLATVTSFLDVGTGVGLLAVAAANVWPSSTIVGIDQWPASLERARANVAHAGLDDRITLREQSLGALDDVDAYDCAWVPTFFVTESALEEALPALVRSLCPNGWLVLARMRTMPDPLAEAVATLRTIRAGGSVLDGKRATELLEGSGCTSVHTAAPQGPAPMEFILGQKPA